MISGLFKSYNINEENIILKLDIQDLDIDVDTVVPLGLITNELVSNALKDGFKYKVKGEVSASLFEEQDTSKLIVQDDGDGIDPDLISREVKSFGYQMIDAFKQKLNVSLDIENKEGASMTLTIKNYVLG